jgi:two-component SAPR family response regulator
MTAAHDDALKGLRTLVVEDDFFVAQSLALVLSKFGCEVVGPVATVQDACNLAEQAEIDMGILDVVIRGGNSEPVARVLISRGCPFLFLTGFRDVDMLSEDLREYPRLQKPADAEALRRAIADRQKGSGQSAE